MTESSFQNLIRKKNVVFITVKNRDYIRVSQIERLLGKLARNYEIFSSEKKNPVTRMFDLKRRIRGIDFSDADVVVVGFLPQLVWKEVSGRARREKKPSLVADFFLSLYDTVVLDRKLIGQKNPLAGILRRMDKRVLEEVDLVLTDTGADASFFAKEFDVDPGKLEVMYLEADSELVTEAENPRDSESVEFPKKDMTKSEDGKDTSEDAFKVLYFGTGLPLQGTDIVMEAFVKASLEYDKFSKERAGISDQMCDVDGCEPGTSKVPEFTYVGSMKHIPIRVRNSAKALNNINIIDWLSQEELYKEIEKADLCLAGHFNPYVDKADRTIPGKAFIYESMGKKMVLGDTQANHELFTEDDRHVFVRRGSATAIAQVILKQLIDE